MRASAIVGAERSRISALRISTRSPTRTTSAARAGPPLSRTRPALIIRVACERENSAPNWAATYTSSRIRPGAEPIVSVRAAMARLYQPRGGWFRGFEARAARRLKSVGRGMGFFVGRYLFVMRERQGYIVEPLDKAFLGKRIDIEMRRPSEFVRHRLRRQIDRQLVSVVSLDRRKDGVDLRGLEHYREEAVLERVVAEDVGERDRDRRLEPEIGQRPDCVLARAAASKVGARDQDRSALETRLFEHVALVRLTAPVEEEPFAQPAAHHGLEELFRNHLVGVDVGAIHGSDQASEIFERLHRTLTLGE